MAVAVAFADDRSGAVSDVAGVAVGAADFAAAVVAVANFVVAVAAVAILAAVVVVEIVLFPTAEVAAGVLMC